MPRIPNLIVDASPTADDLAPSYDNATNLTKRVTLGGIALTVVDTDTSLTGNSDTRYASQKATKTYVDAETTRATAVEAKKASKSYAIAMAIIL